MQHRVRRQSKWDNEGMVDKRGKTNGWPIREKKSEYVPSFFSPWAPPPSAPSIAPRIAVEGLLSVFPFDSAALAVWFLLALSTSLTTFFKKFITAYLWGVDVNSMRVDERWKEMRINSGKGCAAMKSRACIMSLEFQMAKDWLGLWIALNWKPLCTVVSSLIRGS